MSEAGKEEESPAPLAGQAAAPAEVAPVVETPSAPVVEATTTSAPATEPALIATEPSPEIEIEAAPAQPEPPVSAPATDTPHVTDKSSERFSATPSHSPSLDPALRQGPNPVSPPQPATDTSPDKTAVSSAANEVNIKSRLSQAFEALRFKKRAKLDKILLLAAKKKSIKNDDVEKLLRVSDSTAQRYLNQLVLEGKLRRSGITASITYERL